MKRMSNDTLLSWKSYTRYLERATKITRILSEQKKIIQKLDMKNSKYKSFVNCVTAVAAIQLKMKPTSYIIERGYLVKPTGEDRRSVKFRVSAKTFSKVRTLQKGLNFDWKNTVDVLEAGEYGCTSLDVRCVSKSS